MFVQMYMVVLNCATAVARQERWSWTRFGHLRVSVFLLRFEWTLALMTSPPLTANPAVVAELSRHAPFAQMDPRQVDVFAVAGEPVHFVQGQTVLSPDAAR